MITLKQKQNLWTLANYLWNLPDDYSHFGMADFCVAIDDGYTDSFSPNSALEAFDECGTVACAAGHGPSAGILSESNNWDGYILRSFGTLPNSLGYEYCFDWQWEYIDDTHKGAAKRIMAYLINPYVYSSKVMRVNNEWNSELKATYSHITQEHFDSVHAELFTQHV